MCEVVRSPCKGVNIFEIGSWSRLEKDFCKAYKECFGGPPYFEEYEDQWIVENVYNKHLGRGCVAIALHNGCLVGLSCAEAIANDPRSSPFKYLSDRKQSLPFPFETTCYISEVAVVEDMRRRGIGTDLLKTLCDWGTSHKLTHYVARTAAQGSNSLGIFRRHLHANTLEGFQMVENAEGEVPSQSKERIYLWGQLDKYRR